MDEKLKGLNERCDALEAEAAAKHKKGQELAAAGADQADLKAVKDELDALRPQIADIQSERSERIRELEIKGLTETVEDLTKQVNAQRTPTDFKFAGGVPTPGADESDYSDESRSFFADVKSARNGNQAAYNRLMEAGEKFPDHVKAMTEGTDSAGGYLVAPEISSELIRLREQRAVLRQICSKISVTSDTLQIPSVTGGLLAGWVAELAEKPTADMTFGQISVGVYTAAGLAWVSNQLLQDSRPSIDGLVTEDLALRLSLVEEKAFIDGTGSGQPLGILGTSGVGVTTYTDASPTQPELLDALLDSITGVETDYIGFPSHVLMHPRTWAYIRKAKDSNGNYIVGHGDNSVGRRPGDNLPGYTLFGVPVVTSTSIPTNKGTGTNESRIIVGDFSQALILDRQGVTVDLSEHVGFTANKTVFRAEERVGFTAARYPKAFNVVQGTGLIGN